MTAPEPRPGGADGNARGILVLVIAVAVGFLLLWQAGGGGGDDAAGSGQTSSPNTTAPLDGSTTTEATTTTAATTGRAPSEVKVLVLNGGGPAGSAGSTSTQIESSGYVMGEPTNSPTTVEATTFYYADGYQAEATAIALLLGKSTDAVKPLTDAGLSGVEGDANVVVILGPDAPPVSSGSTGSSTTSSTTTTSAG